MVNWILTVFLIFYGSRGCWRIFHLSLFRLVWNSGGLGVPPCQGMVDTLCSPSGGLGLTPDTPWKVRKSDTPQRGGPKNCNRKNNLQIYTTPFGPDTPLATLITPPEGPSVPMYDIPMKIMTTDSTQHMGKPIEHMFACFKYWGSIVCI